MGRTHFLTLCWFFFAARFVHAAEGEEPFGHELTVYNGTIVATSATSGRFGIDAMVDITAPEATGGGVFLMWIGLEAGNSSFSNRFLRETKFRMGDNSAHICAVYGIIRSWCPPALQSNSTGYMWPENPGIPLQSRKELKVQIELVAVSGVGPADNADEDDLTKVWNKLGIELSWMIEGSWPRDKLIRVFTTQTGTAGIEQEDYLSKSLFASSNSRKLWTGSVWYESAWGIADLGPWGPFYQYSLPPVVNLRNRLNVIIPNFSNGNGYSRRTSTEVNLLPIPDIDGDGLPDVWEMSNFGTISLYGSGDDPDGDGLTNAQELAAGTKGANPDSDGDGIPDGSDASPTSPSGFVSETASSLVVWTTLEN